MGITTWKEAGHAESTASSSTAGIVAVGSGLSTDGAGVLSVNVGNGLQIDANNDVLVKESEIDITKLDNYDTVVVGIPQGSFDNTATLTFFANASRGNYWIYTGADSFALGGYTFTNNDQLWCKTTFTGTPTNLTTNFSFVDSAVNLATTDTAGIVLPADDTITVDEDGIIAARTLYNYVDTPITAAYTASWGDVLLVDVSSADVTITLPVSDSTTVGKEICIRKSGYSSGYNIKITPNAANTISKLSGTVSMKHSDGGLTLLSLGTDIQAVSNLTLSEYIIKTITTTTALDSSDYFVVCNNTSAINVTLANTGTYNNVSGSRTTIKNNGSAAVTVYPYSGGDIEGNSSYTLNIGACVTFINNGTSYYILANGTSVVQSASSVGTSISPALYFTNTASVINTAYKQLSYTPDSSATVLSQAVTSSASAVLGTWLFDLPIATTTINAGQWLGEFYSIVSSLAGTSGVQVTVFTRTSAGAETTLFTAQSPDFIQTSSAYLSLQSSQGVFTTTATQYLGVKLTAVTDRSASTTVTISIGGTTSSYVQTPLALRHSQLRNVEGVGQTVTQGHLDNAAQTIYGYKTFNAPTYFSAGKFTGLTSATLVAADTIDKYSQLELSTSAASQTIVLPTPTNSVYQAVTVFNIGSYSFTVNGLAIPVNKAAVFAWSPTLSVWSATSVSSLTNTTISSNGNLTLAANTNYIITSTNTSGSVYTLPTTGITEGDIVKFTISTSGFNYSQGVYFTITGNINGTASQTIYNNSNYTEYYLRYSAASTTWIYVS